jgi:hypothetical protein
MVMVVVIGLASHGGMDHRGLSCRQSHSCMLDRHSRRLFAVGERDGIWKCVEEKSDIPSSARGEGRGGEERAESG